MTYKSSIRLDAFSFGVPTVGAHSTAKSSLGCPFHFEVGTSHIKNVVNKIESKLSLSGNTLKLHELGARV